MNWDAVAAIAEDVGATGVIASLLYLAMQVRASTRASAVEAKLASNRMYTDFLAMLVQNPELNDIFLRGRKDIRSLNPEEYMRFSNMALIEVQAERVRSSQLGMLRSAVFIGLGVVGLRRRRTGGRR